MKIKKEKLENPGRDGKRAKRPVRRWHYAVPEGSY
jgi:hypothetical protein